MSGGPIRFHDRSLLASLALLIGLDPAARREYRRSHPWTPPQLPRWMRRSGRSGPFNRDQECARRRRQLANGTLKVTVRR